MNNGLQILQSLSNLERSCMYHQYLIYLMVKLLHIQLAQDQPILLFQRC